jgi:hypothetical protein
MQMQRYDIERRHGPCRSRAQERHSAHRMASPSGNETGCASTPALPGVPGYLPVRYDGFNYIFSPFLSLGSPIRAFEHPVIEVRKIAMRCAVPVAAPARGARGRPARRAPATGARSRVRSGWHGPPARSHDTTCTTSTESSAPHRTTPDRLALHTRGVGVLITRTCARLFTRRAHHGPVRDAGGQLRSDPSSDVGRIGLPFVWVPACEQLLLLGYMPVPREERSVVAGPRSPGFVRNRNTAEV